MTVAELIEKLKRYPQDAEVLDCDPCSMGKYTPVDVSLGYVRARQSRSGRHIEVVEAEPNEPGAQVAVHIG